jgi:hypothetical protein
MNPSPPGHLDGRGFASGRNDSIQKSLRQKLLPVPGRPVLRADGGQLVAVRNLVRCGAAVNTSDNTRAAVWRWEMLQPHLGMTDPSVGIDAGLLMKVKEDAYACPCGRVCVHFFSPERVT